MFSLFKPRSVLVGSDLDFQIETYKYLMKYFGGESFYTKTKLVLPTDEFFPDSVSSEDEIASKTFHQVKKHSGMCLWPCQLIAQEPDPNRHLGGTLLIRNAPSLPRCTYSLGEEGAEITFNPNLLRNPVMMVALFANRLAFYLTQELTESPPGGWSNLGYANDITAVFLGFGIFSVNSVFNFQQFSDGEIIGWMSERNGCLSDVELLFALAIFCKLKGINPVVAASHIKPALRKIFYNCIKQIDANEDFLSEIESVEFVGDQYHKHPRFS
ncbi:hypothetical protein GT360_17705 [Vibrio astriarenae]|uniref:Uncharacterized protein n=1 Tax=Vibrio astriarenae TaxID=1481923 RepID=A0A7Z2YFQ5_9VIBR|nr:hypothetical protein [Vibrio astriarenae]QIA65375.1 hypothetical protein GT360_17705 [Vibrio astriarenae]